MRILFDQGVPAPLRFELAGHTVVTASEKGWGALENGDLLRAAESAFDVFITTDQSVRYQQNLVGRRLSILVLMTTSWPRIQLRLADVVGAAGGLQPGEYRELTFPK